MVLPEAAVFCIFLRQRVLQDDYPCDRSRLSVPMPRGQPFLWLYLSALSVLLLVLRQIPAGMGMTERKCDIRVLSVHFFIYRIGIAFTDSMKSFQKLLGMFCFPGLLIFIKNDHPVRMILPRTVYPHKTLAVYRRCH